MLGGRTEGTGEDGKDEGGGVGWKRGGEVNSEETHRSIFSVRCWETDFEHLAPYPKKENKKINNNFQEVK